MSSSSTGGGASSGRSTRSSGKKESFQWNTPADEFADDVGSDDEGEYRDANDEDPGTTTTTTTVVVTEICLLYTSPSPRD